MMGVNKYLKSKQYSIFTSNTSFIELYNFDKWKKKGYLTFITAHSTITVL